MNKVKMYETDIYKLKAHYHDFYRVKHDVYGYGTAFIFDNMSNIEMQAVKSYRNTKISIGQYKYANYSTSKPTLCTKRSAKE